MATERTKRNSKTARECYKQQSQDVGRLMKWLESELTTHNDQSAAEPTSYAFVGDLCHVSARLIELVAFITNNEPEEIERQLSNRR